MLAEEQGAHNCSNTMSSVLVQMCSLSSVNKQSYEFDTPVHQHLWSKKQERTLIEDHKNRKLCAIIGLRKY